MKTLLRQDIPGDYSYYRTGSRVFYEYLKRFRSYIVEKVGDSGQFFSAFQMVPGFWSIIAEKVDFDLTKEKLLSHGIRHGIIWWSPLRVTEKPQGWIRLPSWFAKYDLHSSRSAFSLLDREDFWSKWSPKARAHRRKVLEYRESGKIRISRDISLTEFLDLYRDTPSRDSEKSFRLRLAKKLFENTESLYRIYVVYVDERPLAGALFIDEGVTSEYFISFYHRDGYPYHLGVAIMDIWMLDSYEKGIKYADLDHMRDSWQSFGYAGYTKFKESIADHDVYFREMWIKIF